MSIRCLSATLLILATLSSFASADQPSKSRSIRLADGKIQALRAPEKGAMALVFCSTECPISNGYSPTLNDLSLKFRDAKVDVIGVFVDPDLTDEALIAHAKEYQLKFPVAADADASIMKGYDSVSRGDPEYAQRTSYVISPAGQVLFTYTAGDPTHHVEYTMNAVKKYVAEHK